MRPDISVLTDPIPIGRYAVSEPIIKIARRVRYIGSPRPVHMRSKYRAHFAVTRSMVEGLQKIGIRSNYNPKNLKEVAEVVVVPGGFHALRQAIGWKQTGYIRTLLAGPNLVDFPSENRQLMCASEIDVLIVPGNWVVDNFISDRPELRGRVKYWPSGVDTNYWFPSSLAKEPNKVLIYDKPKRGPVCLIDDYARFIEGKNYHVDILYYGQYIPNDYLEMLRKCSVMIGFSPDESQGIAWAEAWSVNVPTLLWNQDYVTFKGRTYRASTSPYLTSKTGMFFYSFLDFEKVFEYWVNNWDQFHPRDWVIENMSDEVCAKNLCKLANIPVSR